MSPITLFTLQVKLILREEYGIEMTPRLKALSNLYYSQGNSMIETVRMIKKSVEEG